MTIDFSNFGGSINLYGTAPDNSDRPFYAKFLGKYSNKYLEWNAGGNTELSLNLSYSVTNHYYYTWASSYNRTRDIQGYYTMEIYGLSGLLDSQLVKIINAYVDSRTDFISPDNEDNEQVIFYR